MHLLPLWMPAEVEATGMVSQVLPWGAPALLGMTGTTAAASPEPVVLVGYEQPLFGRALGRKAEVEALHAERFRVDHRARLGRSPFASIAYGPDPPDLVATTADGARLGLECTALADQDRRRALGRLAALRKRLLASPSSRFCHLRGHQLHVWFGDDAAAGAPALPHRRGDATAWDAVVAALEAYRPSTEQLRADPGEPAPARAPDLGAVATDHG